MIKNILILLILLIFPVFINCNSNNNPQSLADNKLNQNKKEIIVSDLEIINTPNQVASPAPENDDWKPVKIPFIHKTGAPFYLNLRSFWLRGKFTAEPSEIKIKQYYYGIRLGMIFPVFVNLMHINKELINTNILADPGNWIEPSSYILPANINLKETNEIYIRFITDREIVTWLSDIVIQEKSEYLRSRKWDNFIFNQLPVGYCVLLIGLLIILLYKFITQKNKRYLFYSLYLLCIIIIPIVFYSPVDLFKPDLIIAIIYSIIAFQPLLIILIFQSIYGAYFTKQNLISFSISVLAALFIFISIYYLFKIENAYNQLGLITIILWFYLPYLIKSLNKLKPDKFKFKILIILYLLKVILDIIYSIGFNLNIWYYNFAYIYSTLFFIVFIIIYEARENKKRRIELQKLYDKLEKDNNQTLTETAEKKIEKIINFLNENFTSDISREGLASTVDMSPNYMSRLFSLHTGKKINEYINHLRIAFAAKQLAEPENGKSIIDIALTVGFESLSTFNRAFKEVYKTTPTEYKKKNKENEQSNNKD